MEKSVDQQKPHANQTQCINLGVYEACDFNTHWSFSLMEEMKNIDKNIISVWINEETQALFTRQRTRIKETKYFIGCAFNFNSDCVFWGLKMQKTETTHLKMLHHRVFM